MSQEANEMSLSQLGQDAVSEMPPVSPQFQLKPATPDPDGKYRDILGKIFEVERHATDRKGVPLKTPRGYFKLLPGVPAKKSQTIKRNPVQVQETNEDNPPRQTIPPSKVEDVIGRANNAPGNPEAQKKKYNLQHLDHFYNRGNHRNRKHRIRGKAVFQTLKI